MSLKMIRRMQMSERWNTIFLVCMIVTSFILFLMQLISPHSGLYIKIGIVSLMLPYRELIKSISKKNKESFLEFKQCFQEIVERIYTTKHNLKETQIVLEDDKIEQLVQSNLNRLTARSRLFELIFKTGNIVVVLNCGFIMVMLLEWSHIPALTQNIMYALPFLTMSITFFSDWCIKWYSKKLKEEKESLNHIMDKSKEFEKMSKAFVLNSI